MNFKNLLKHVVASRYSRNYIICEKYKRVHSFKLQLLQNNYLVQLYSSASDFKRVENIPGSYFVKPFQLVCCILNYVSSIIKARHLNVDFNQGNR